MTDKGIAAAVGVVHPRSSIELRGTEQRKIAADGYSKTDLIPGGSSGSSQDMVLKIRWGLERPNTVVLKAVAKGFPLRGFA